MNANGTYGQKMCQRKNSLAITGSRCEFSGSGRGHRFHAGKFASTCSTQPHVYRCAWRYNCLSYCKHQTTYGCMVEKNSARNHCPFRDQFFTARQLQHLIWLLTCTNDGTTTAHMDACFRVSSLHQLNTAIYRPRNGNIDGYSHYYF